MFSLATKPFHKKTKPIDKTILVLMARCFPHTTLLTDPPVGLQCKWHYRNNQRWLFFFFFKWPLKRRKTCSWTISSPSILVLKSIRDHYWPCKCVWRICLHPETRERRGQERQCIFGKGSIMYLHILLRRIACNGQTQAIQFYFFFLQPCYSYEVPNREADLRPFKYCFVWQLIKILLDFSFFQQSNA